MARQVIVLALIFVAVAGLVSAQQPPARAPTSAPSANAPKPGAHAPSASGPASYHEHPSTTAASPTAEGPTTEDNPDVAMPAPVGSETNADAPTESGASALQVSAVVAGVAVAGFFY